MNGNAHWMRGLGAWLLWAALGCAQEPAPVAVPPTADAAAEAPATVSPPVASTLRRTRDLPFTYGRDLVLGPSERSRDIVLISGDLKLDGTVRQAVVVFGNVELNGVVERDLVVLGGNLKLGPQARVDQELVFFGKTFEAAPSAELGNDPLVISTDRIPVLRGFVDWVSKGLLWGRPLPPTVGWAWFFVLSFALFYLLVSLVFARSSSACAEALSTRPAGTLLLGILTLLLVPPLIVVLVATGIGLVVIPFVCCALFFAFIVGKVAIFRCAGEQLGEQLGVGILGKPLVALVAGMVLFVLVYMIPVVGFLVWGLLVPSALGAGVLAAFGALSTERPRPNDPQPMGAGGGSGGAGVGMAAGVGMPMGTDVPIAAPGIVPAGAAGIGWRPAGGMHVERAGFWVRTLASVIDLMVLGVVAKSFHPSAPWFLIMLVGYHIVMWGWRGATLGGMVIGVRLAQLDGSPISWSLSILRALAAFVSGIACFLGFFWVGWTAERRSWHDRIAGTVMLRQRSSLEPAAPPLPPARSS